MPIRILDENDDPVELYRYGELADRPDIDASPETIKHWAIGDDRYGLDLSDYHVEREDLGCPYLKAGAVDAILEHEGG